MIRWLLVDSTPSWALCSPGDRGTVADYAPDMLIPRLLSVSSIRAPAALDGGGEAANISIQANNGDGKYTDFLERAPLGVEAVLYGLQDGALRTLFTGTITRVDCGDTITLSLVG